MFPTYYEQVAQAGIDLLVMKFECIVDEYNMICLSNQWNDNQFVCTMINKQFKHAPYVIVFFTNFLKMDSPVSTFITLTKSLLQKLNEMIKSGLKTLYKMFERPGKDTGSSLNASQENQHEHAFPEVVIDIDDAAQGIPSSSEISTNTETTISNENEVAIDSIWTTKPEKPEPELSASENTLPQTQTETFQLLEKHDSGISINSDDKDDGILSLSFSDHTVDDLEQPMPTVIKENGEFVIQLEAIDTAEVSKDVLPVMPVMPVETRPNEQSEPEKVLWSNVSIETPSDTAFPKCYTYEVCVYAADHPERSTGIVMVADEIDPLPADVNDDNVSLNSVEPLQQKEREIPKAAPLLNLEHNVITKQIDLDFEEYFEPMVKYLDANPDATKQEILAFSNSIGLKERKILGMLLVVAFVMFASRGTVPKFYYIPFTITDSSQWIVDNYIHAYTVSRYCREFSHFWGNVL
ncbi:hypothetical protein HK103_005563 [Boothiomyces macroporosus]|uniref:Uncharacterized protein n=1 Tax=Boothiomyces macroporosus TaxID=261099 RepID=A0AAD5UF23_9FUNG|nr:hypothetical protein HK103_005563 [Boothiomyces macroporosus]